MLPILHLSEFTLLYFEGGGKDTHKYNRGDTDGRKEGTHAIFGELLPEHEKYPFAWPSTCVCKPFSSNTLESGASHLFLVSHFWLRQEPKESRCCLSVRACVRDIMLKKALAESQKGNLRVI